MATDVVMPQMGESIAEGTIVRWIKKVGDKVDRDEPLFEISTDKVDAEIPSPAAGDRRARSASRKARRSRSTACVAVIDAADAAARCARAEIRQLRPTAPAIGARRGGRRVRAPRVNRRRLRVAWTTARVTATSPLVRKIAKEHNVDISQIHGTGIARPGDQGRHPRLPRTNRAGRANRSGRAGGPGRGGLDTRSLAIASSRCR